MLGVGSLVAGYRIERVLGQGGMGAVYLVANPELPRKEALKLLSGELSRDKGFRARFLREADVASQLDHPNIVSIHRRGQTDDGQLWIAMQFVDGTDADAAMRTGQMTPERAVHIIGEVAKALDYAHRHNVLHRDVKPANFLLSGPPGPDERVLLGDFGIARAFDDASLTGTGQLMATVAYAPPEAISGNPVDWRADQYSLGCALFRLLTGKTPFADAKGQAGMMKAHLQQPPPRVTEVAPWLPPAMDAVIATVMAKDPARRFGSCTELAAAAKAALRQPTPNNEPTQRVTPPPRQHSTPPPVYRPPSPPPPPPPQHRPPTWVTPPAPRPPLTGWPTPPVPQPAQPPAQRGPRSAIIAAAAGVIVIAVAAVTVLLWPSGKSDTTAATATTATVAATTRSGAPTTTTPAAPPAVVSAADLPGFLLSADELSAVMGDPLQADPIRDTMWDDSGSISDKDCLSAWMPAQAPTYNGSGFTDVRGQVVKQTGVTHDAVSVAQALIAFPDQEAARPTATSVPEQWKACAGRTFTITTAKGPQPWTFGQQAMPAPGLYTMPIAKQGGSNQCGRALMLRANIIIDILACGPGVTNQNVDIANKIAAKIPQ